MGKIKKFRSIRTKGNKRLEPFDDNYCEYYCSGNSWALSDPHAASGYTCPPYLGGHFGCSEGNYTDVPAVPTADLFPAPDVPKNKGEYTMVKRHLFLKRSNADSKHYCPPILKLREIARIDKRASVLLDIVGRASFVTSITVFINAIRSPGSRSRKTGNKRGSNRGKARSKR